MNDLERSYEQLPHDVARRTIGGWSEARLLQAGSFVAAYGGPRSSTVHDEACAADEGIWRLGAQIELHRAAGDVDAEHAVNVLTKLTKAQQSDQFIRRLAERTLVTLDARGAQTSELREALVYFPRKNSLPELI